MNMISSFSYLKKFIALHHSHTPSVHTLAAMLCATVTVSLTATHCLSCCCCCCLRPLLLPPLLPLQLSSALLLPVVLLCSSLWSSTAAASSTLIARQQRSCSSCRRSTASYVGCTADDEGPLRATSSAFCLSTCTNAVVQQQSQ
jgi:hypothetical protein